MPRRKRREYTPEQKADAIRLVRETGNAAKSCQDPDQAESSVRFADDFIVGS